jgi:HAD superfamily hydrolase (TIGR01549 family)
MEMALRGILFDLDGTLVDTNGAHTEAWRLAFEHLGYRIPFDRIAPEIGKGGDKLVPSILGEEAEKKDGDALREKAAEEFLAIAGREKFELFDGAVEILDALRSRGMKLALATSAKQEYLDAIFTSAGVDLRPKFDAIITADDADASKPAPDLVLAAVEKLGMAPAECGMIGDTPHDAAASRRAGVVCLGILGGVHTAEGMMCKGAREVWKSLRELTDSLDQALETAAPGPVPIGHEMAVRLMREAIAIAREGMEKGEAPIGCVLARGDGSIIGRGHNRVKGASDKIAHAEIETFRAVAGKIPLDARDLILVSTLEPCVMCTGAAMEAAVDTIIFGLAAPADSGSERVRPPSSPESQMPRIIGGVLSDESRALFVEWIDRGLGDEQQIAYVEQLLSITRES